MGTEATNQAEGDEPAQRRSDCRLRVAWLAGAETFERLGRILEPLAIGLTDEPVSLLVACPEETPLRPLPAPAVEVLRYRRPRWWHVRRRRRLEDLAERLRERRITLLHALEADQAATARRLADLIDARYVVNCWSRADRHRVWPTGRRCAAVLSASEPIRTQLLKHARGAGSKVHLLRPGVYQIRQASCFTNPQLSAAIIVSGPMDHAGPFEPLFRCFAELQARKYDCAFFVLGNGRAERSIRKLAERMRLREGLTFADRQPLAQMPGVFKAADVYISPSPNREIDVESLLAMSAGVPVLSAGNGASDFMRNSQTAILYSSGDASELTMKLTSLLDDHDAAVSLAQSALNYLREHHSAGKMVAETLKVYQEAVQ